MRRAITASPGRRGGHAEERHEHALRARAVLIEEDADTPAAPERVRDSRSPRRLSICSTPLRRRNRSTSRWRSGSSRGRTTRDSLEGGERVGERKAPPVPGGGRSGAACPSARAAAFSRCSWPTRSSRRHTPARQSSSTISARFMPRCAKDRRASRLALGRAELVAEGAWVVESQRTPAREHPPAQVTEPPAHPETRPDRQMCEKPAEGKEHREPERHGNERKVRRASVIREAGCARPSPAMAADRGMVRIHAHTMLPGNAPAHGRQPLASRPTPTIEPVMVCVVLTGMPPTLSPMTACRRRSRRRSRRPASAW